MQNKTARRSFSHRGASVRKPRRPVTHAGLRLFG